MANPLTLTLPMPADVALETGMYGAGAVIRVQTATADTGPFADVTGTGSTPTIPIVSGTDTYPGRDPAGSSSSWYRTRIENVGATRVSEWSEVFQAQGTTSTAIGRYANLARAKIKLAITDDDDDELLQTFCNSADAWLEGKLRRPVYPIGSAVYLFNGFDAVDSGRTILVPNGVRSVSLIRIAMQTNAPLDTSLATTDFVLRPPVQQRTPGHPADMITIVDYPLGGSTSLFWPGYANVEVTMTCGFAVTPDELTQLGDTLAIAAWRGRGSTGGDRVTVGTTDERVFDSAMSQQDWMTLKRYALGPRS